MPHRVDESMRDCLAIDVAGGIRAGAAAGQSSITVSLLSLQFGRGGGLPVPAARA